MKNISAPSSVRRLGLAFVLAASSLVSVAVASTAQVASAADPISVTASTTFKSYTTNRSEWLPKFTVKNLTTSNLVIGVSFSQAPAGTKFSIGQYKGLTLKYGYSGWKYRSSIAFTGKTADVNRALASMKLHTTGNGKVTVKVSATADDTTLAYEPISSHYYGFIEAKGAKWTDALAAASTLSFRETPAYLAAITTADENDFISYNIENAANAWIGASDKDVEGEFKWATGEVADKTFWKAACAGLTGADACTGANNVLTGGWAGTYTAKVSDTPVVNTYSSWDRTDANLITTLNYHEPNNWGADEDYVATNWKGSVGLWNDLPNDAGMQNGQKVINGYIVEFAAPAGKPFKGVFEASASYQVLNAPTEFAPRKVKLLKWIPDMGTVKLSWSAPDYKNKALLAKMKVSVKEYYVTSSVRPGEKFCVTKNTGQTNLGCDISGFMSGEELYLTVNASYTKPPKGGGLFRLGQSTYGVSVIDKPFDVLVPFTINVQIQRQVRAGASVKVAGTGLKAGTAFTVTANNTTLVYRGTVGSDGNIPSSASFKIPAAGFVADRWNLALYTLNATNADGSAVVKQVSFWFMGSFYMWSNITNGAVASDYAGVAALPHTAIAG